MTIGEDSIWAPAALPAALTALLLPAAGAGIYANAGWLLAWIGQALPAVEALRTDETPVTMAALKDLAFTSNELRLLERV